jgi:acetyl/propionyl-CoA carboxylase alpha subunit
MERTLSHGTETIRLSARRKRDQVHLTTPAGERSFHWEKLGAGDYLLQSGGKLRRCVVARRGEDRWVWIEGRVHHLKTVTGGRSRSARSGDLTAPMPGQVLTVMVSAGDAVDRNQTLVVMEAMKMQCEIKSPRKGIVRAVHTEAGAQVAGGIELISLEESGS